jgi:hypothetical protein
MVGRPLPKMPRPYPGVLLCFAEWHFVVILVVIMMMIIIMD